MLKYEGEINYTFNMFDSHIKTCHFSLLSEQPMTYNSVKGAACEQCHNELGIAQRILSVSYTTENIGDWKC
jgi:hypothetical protein